MLEIKTISEDVLLADTQHSSFFQKAVSYEPENITAAEETYNKLKTWISVPFYACIYRKVGTQTEEIIVCVLVERRLTDLTNLVETFTTMQPDLREPYKLHTVPNTAVLQLMKPYLNQ